MRSKEDKKQTRATPRPRSLSYSRTSHEESRLFHSNDYRAVQDKVRDLINSSPDLLSKNTAQSPRAAGDAIESVVAASFDKILGDHCGEYSSSFARRAMADLAFKDREGLYYIVDVKTHRTDTKFNMPNLTSVERLARFYEDDSNFSLCFSSATASKV